LNLPFFLSWMSFLEGQMPPVPRFAAPLVTFLLAFFCPSGVNGHTSPHGGGRLPIVPFSVFPDPPSLFQEVWIRPRSWGSFHTSRLSRFLPREMVKLSQQLAWYDFTMPHQWCSPVFVTVLQSPYVFLWTFTSSFLPRCDFGVNPPSLAVAPGAV